jgi:hypothetical protein
MAKDSSQFSSWPHGFPLKFIRVYPRKNAAGHLATACYCYDHEPKPNAELLTTRYHFLPPNTLFMKTLCFLFLASFLPIVTLADDSSVPAAAQTQSPSALGKAMPADPAAVEAALKAMHYDEMIGKLVDQQKQAIFSRMQQTLSMMKSAVISREEFAAFEQKAMDDVRDGITPGQIHGDLVRVYGEVFTTDELQAMANFYNTPAGQAISVKQADLEKKVTDALRPRLLQLMSKTQRVAAKFAMLQQAKAKKTADEAAAANAKDQKAPGAAATPTTGASSAPTTTPASAPSASLKS